MKKYRKKNGDEETKSEISFPELVEDSGISASQSELDGHGAHGREEEIFVAQELLHLFFFRQHDIFSHQQMKRE